MFHICTCGDSKVQIQNCRLVAAVKYSWHQHDEFTSCPLEASKVNHRGTQTLERPTERSRTQFAVFHRCSWTHHCDPEEELKLFSWEDFCSWRASDNERTQIQTWVWCLWVCPVCGSWHWKNVMISEMKQNLKTTEKKHQMFKLRKY